MITTINQEAILSGVVSIQESSLSGVVSIPAAITVPFYEAFRYDSDNGYSGGGVDRMIQVEGIFVGGGEATKSYTLEVKTENPNSKVDYVYYYYYYYYYDESGKREKTSVYLSTSYQTITFCDGFLAVYKGSDNVVSAISCYDSYDNTVYTIAMADSFGIWVATTGQMVLNIAYLLEEYPNIKKISFCYMD